MSTETVAVQVPVPLYQRLTRLAALTNRDALPHRPGAALPRPH